MAVVRKVKSGNGQITPCRPLDGRRQPRYNLTLSAPSNHNEFHGNGASNVRAYREHTHTHRQFGFIYQSINLHSITRHVMNERHNSSYRFELREHSLYTKGAYAIGNSTTK